MQPAHPYRPALLPGGGVSLARSVAFAALYQELLQARVDEHMARLVDEIDAARATSEPSPDGDAPQPQTYEQMMGREPVGPAAASNAASLTPPATGFEAFEAVIHGGWGPRFAAVCVWAESPGAPETPDTPAGFRAITPEEAARATFPVAPFAEALLGFWKGATPLIAGLQNTPLPTE